MMDIPRIAITMGDPAGIGPEIVLQAITRLRDRVRGGDFHLVAIGCGRTLDATAARLGLENPMVAQASDAYAARPEPIAFVDIGGDDEIAPGRISELAGELAYRAIETAVKLALGGAVDAICTAPINKEAMNLAGHHYSGHTELLAELTGADDSVMLLAHGAMRVTHVTTHVALEEVTGRVTPERIARVVSLTDDALHRLGVAQPRIAVAALNPHAGEGGLFGRHDLDVVSPTVARLREDGLNVVGPLSGDTIFVKLRAGEYDAVVAMYHDQGHIPVKLLGFSVDPATGRWEALSGVNVTLGLPIIRTSVDHGTAFDIAGKGIASDSSLCEAVDFAVMLAGRGR